MPTNSDYDGFFSGISGVPLFTYGMILTTSIVLAYMTIMEPDLPSTEEVVQEVVEATNDNSPFMTPAVPLPETTSAEGQEPIEDIPQPSVEEEEQPIEEIPQQSVEEEQPQQPSIGGRKRKTKRRRPKHHN
jgi:hypothetical protein